MRVIRHLLVFVVVVGLGALQSKAVNAADAYQGFVATSTQIAGLGGGAYNRCLEQSGGNTGAILNCIDIEYGRLDLRLNASYRVSLRRLSQTKSMTLRSSERLWVATRDEACLEQLKYEREAGGTIYSVDLRACRLEELKRRIIWIETRR